MPKKRKNLQTKNVAVFNYDDLPTKAKNKIGGKNEKGVKQVRMRKNDLTPAQRAQADSADVTVILQDGEMMFIAPTGEMVSALKSVLDEINA
jgi:hypothetical protein